MLSVSIIIKYQQIGFFFAFSSVNVLELQASCRNNGIYFSMSFYAAYSQQIRSLQIKWKNKINGFVSVFNVVSCYQKTDLLEGNFFLERGKKFEK